MGETPVPPLCSAHEARMKPRELDNLGVPRGEAMKLAQMLCARAAAKGVRKDDLRSRIAAILASPAARLDDPHFGELAALLCAAPPPAPFIARDVPAPWRQWGDDLEPQSVEQMVNACQLPIAVAGALMPDAHVGYGLPIGGVLATDNAVIPYAVGVDIACRMKLTVLDMPGGATALTSQFDRLVNAIERETRFGVGANFSKPHEHEVMDADWSVTRVTQAGKDKAWTQLGTSGSGNHFVEFGTLTLDRDELGLRAGTHLALLSHSGSRGVGAAVADQYSKLAMRLHPELPKHLQQLAWLDLDTEPGQEYWAAMSLMGRYAAANHAVIHRSIARHLGVDVLLDVENHHNFAWKETHTIPVAASDAPSGRREVIVHRKGATPAGAGVLGIIPGSMATPGFIVRGKGEPASLQSASHGAGRVMSRTQARSSFTWSGVRKQLEAGGVKLLSAGLDEVPGVYKDIHQVMGHQRDLVDVVARFDPKIVKMAPAGERAED
jgi:tRNA-splicing ligase RtcB (3'-phosphate/5'-hydroxy nucleic acid ligase)